MLIIFMINLLPYKEKKSIERIRFVRMVQAVTMALLLLIIISFVLLVPTWITINSRLNIVSNQVASLEKNGMIATSVDLASLEGRVASIKSKLAAPTQTSPTEFVNIIRALTPAGITINRFTTEDGVLLEVFGVSQNRELLQSFIAALGADSSVAMIDNPVSNFIKNKNGTFKLTISFK